MGGPDGRLAGPDQRRTAEPCGHGIVGEELHALATELFPITRSIAGPGLRETLDRLERLTGPMQRHRFATDERVFDWTIPCEWELLEAWIRGPDGELVVTAADTNLHVVSHSDPVHEWLELDELDAHLHSLPEQPDAIPYRTSYYERSWGFCLSENQRRALRPGRYEVLLDATLEPGRVELGEVTIPGTSDQEVLVSCYCCHPSLANNELSGPVVVAALARTLLARADACGRPRLTYRFLFAPETIGAVAYLSRFGERLLERLVAGYVVNCVGIPAPATYKRSRRGDTTADRAAEHVLRHLSAGGELVDFYPPRSDERQYCSPGFNLPFGSLTRGGYDSWPEYHTSLDDLSLITPTALGESYATCLAVLDALEANERLAATIAYGEPQLGRRGLYPTTGGAWHLEDGRDRLEDMMFLLNFCDGEPDLLAAAERAQRPIWELRDAAEILLGADLLRRPAG